MDNLPFIDIPLEFIRVLGEDLFALKNNATVGKTLEHARYQKLREVVLGAYPDALGLPLGRFLHNLKQAGNPLYLRFLNPHGDRSYIQFRPQLGPYKPLKGLYRYTVAGRVVYVGLSLDSFGRRIGSGYGSISPKNCYLDGQSTNCHLNALLAQHWDEVQLSILPMTDAQEIVALERALIRGLRPEWNVQLKPAGLES